MSALEGRYRRLLTAYPPEHRHEYGREMLGVLMAGARPGQRLPALGETTDLLRSGVLARLGRGLREQRRSGWRDAAAVVGLLLAVVLAAAAGRRVGLGLQAQFQYGQAMRAFGVDGLLILDVEVRTAAWFAVVTAALLGARRTAAWLAVAAALAEIGAMAVWLPFTEFRPFHVSWSPVFVALTVICLFAARPASTGFEVLGRRGTLLAIGSIVFLAATALYTSVMPTTYLSLSLFLAGGSLMQGLAMVAAAAMLIAGLRSAPPGIRRRIVVLLARQVTPALIAGFAALVVGVPVVVLALGVAVVRRQEQVQRGGAA
jgi:hypothetical protein